MASVYDDILLAFVDTITGLGLLYNGNPLPINLRKLPAREETLDELPLICVCPHDRPERFRQLSFEDDCGVEKQYFIQVALILAGGRDLSTNIEVVTNYRQRVSRAFSRAPLVGGGPGAALVWDMQPEFETVFDRGAIADNYDYDLLAFWAKTAEQRTN